MRLSKRSEYGIKAAVRLSIRHGAGYLQSREIAETEGLPAKFLESILLSLRSAGVLVSKVGAGGGYRLGRPPEQIRITELIAILERSDPVVENHAAGGPDAPRPGQSAIEVLNGKIDESLEGALGGLSLAELASLARERLSKGDGAMYYI